MRHFINFSPLCKAIGIDVMSSKDHLFLGPFWPQNTEERLQCDDAFYDFYPPTNLIFKSFFILLRKLGLRYFKEEERETLLFFVTKNVLHFFVIKFGSMPHLHTRPQKLCYIGFSPLCLPNISYHLRCSNRKMFSKLYFKKLILLLSWHRGKPWIKL